MKLLNHSAPAAWKNWSSNIMTEITLKVTDESLLPMLRKLFRSLDGVEVVTRRRKKSGLEKAVEDVAAGRVTKWENEDQMFESLMSL